MSKLSCVLFSGVKNIEIYLKKVPKKVHNSLVFERINFKTRTIKLTLNVQIAPSRHRASELVLASKYLSRTKNTNISMNLTSCFSTVRVASNLQAHLVSLSDFTLHKIASFPLRIPLVNVTKSAGNCGFGHIY